MDNVMELPDIFWKLIFNDLDYQDLLVFSLVSRRTYTLASENWLWKNHLIKKFHVSFNTLQNRIWENAPYLFKTIFLKLLKLTHRDFFIFRETKNIFDNVTFLLAFSGSDDLLNNYQSITSCDLNVEDIFGRNILDYAALGGSLICFEFLQAKGIKPSNSALKGNLLHSASIGGSLEILRKVVLLNYVPLDIRDPQNRNAIYFAVLSGNDEGVKYLLSLKDIRCYSMSMLTKMNPLHHAAAMGNLAIFVLLVSTNKFDFTDIDCLNRNVLHHAYRGKCADIYNYIEKNSKVELNKPDRLGFFPKDYLYKTPGSNIGPSSFWKRRQSLVSQHKEHVSKCQNKTEHSITYR